MLSPLIQALHRFSDPHSEADLQALDTAVQKVSPASCADAEFQAMLGVFERFPEEDGYGVFWGILHALEACEGYEPELLASVTRSPCVFNVLMVNRLLNAGISEVKGQSLESILRDVISSPRATPQAVRDAKKYLARRVA